MPALHYAPHAFQPKAIAPSLYPKNPYHPVRDFAPVSFVSTVPLVLEIHPSVLARAAIKDRFASFGAESFSSTPEQLGTFIKQDFAKWTKVVKDANIRVE